MAFHITPRVAYAIADRRRNIAALIDKNPNIKHSELARILKVDKGTIHRDIKAMAEELNLQTVDDFLLHRERVLAEIRAQKIECQTRLKGCKGSAGSRWMQEWTNLIEKECKILCMFTPDKVLASGKKVAVKESKEELDAAVMSIFEGDIIDITPESEKKKGSQKQITDDTL